MESIKSLQELIRILKQSDPKDFPKILKAMDVPSSDFNRFMSWKPMGYTRNCVKRDSNFELVLLCWNPGDATPIHSHAGQKCWVYQVSGNISEKRYVRTNAGELQITSSLALYPGRLTYIEDIMGYHVLENDSGKPATTLHLYMLPIDACEYFCEEETVFKEKKLYYDTMGEL